MSIKKIILIGVPVVLGLVAGVVAIFRRRKRIAQ